MDLSNLNSLKVTDLKQQLKARGLSIVGNKSDLIQRLENEILKESSITEARDENISKTIEKEIDEDAILGGDDDVALEKPDDSLIHNEDLLLSETLLDTTSNIKNSSNQSQNGSKTIQILESPKIAKLDSKETPTNNIAKVAQSEPQVDQKKKILTSDEKKQIRLQKFADPKLQNRAERFGISSAKPVVSSENEKLKQRIQRFGEVVSSKAKTIDEKERVEKRRERFGLVNNQTSKVGTNSKINPMDNDKISKRQERFGIVSNTESKANSNQNGFKRRRFAF